jgi:hypothetical protein
MNFLYLNIKAISRGWDVSYDECASVITIHNDNVKFRVYNNLNNSREFFIVGDGVNTTPLGEYAVIDFFARFIS